MRIARVCDPVAQESFPSFVHRTTTYVGIPHGAPSQLFVMNDDEPSWVSIVADGRQVHVERLSDGQAVIELHKLTAPSPNRESLFGLGDTLAQIIALARRKPDCRQTRLYAFSVVLHKDTPERQVLATYDFHVLCPEEFEAACAFHSQICQRPTAITPDTISDRAEGRHCPHCREVRQNRT